MEYQNKTITLKDGRTALLRAVCKEDAIPMIAYMKACYEQTPYLLPSQQSRRRPIWKGSLFLPMC